MIGLRDDDGIPKVQVNNALSRSQELPAAQYLCMERRDRMRMILERQI